MQQFENDVKTYGTQTTVSYVFSNLKFENDVKTYGTQTLNLSLIPNSSLRMM